ncbi:Predicted arabinose efflux permease, MFS family [Bacillus sp. 491mf]|uniref:MFS transporter n=1 Tax=Bacillus sp. 491mf TaxID=1761755 RepID=UPI0008E3592C|nr:MFS transporter [Bacillus sp. 491mf]SFD23342.1 Predicted arabinose efflux permease, MFS family [Bacillus sp. 491mf]
MMNKNILTLLFVRIVANFSDSLYYMATIWFVKETMSSNTWIGIASFVTLLPVALQIFYGPIIDKYSKKTLLLIAMGIQAVILTLIVLLYYVNQLHPPVLLWLIFIATLAADLGYPTESALIPSLVEKEQLGKVNSVFAFTYNSLDIICNAVSGLIIATIGIGMVYFFNSITYVILFFVLWILLKLPRLKQNETNQKVAYKKEFLEGLRYFWKLGELRTFICVFTIINMLMCIPLGLMPILAHTEKEYGMWMTAISIGTLLGSMLSGKLFRYRLKSVFVTVNFIGGSAWFLSYLFLSSSLLSALVLLAMSWMMIGVMGVQFQTILQTSIDGEYLGRALTVVYAIQGALAPLGYLLGGVLADYVPTSQLYSIGAITLLLAGMYFTQSPFLSYKIEEAAFRERDNVERY